MDHPTRSMTRIDINLLPLIATIGWVHFARRRERTKEGTRLLGPHRSWVVVAVTRTGRAAYQLTLVKLRWMLRRRGSKKSAFRAYGGTVVVADEMCCYHAGATEGD